MDFGELHPLVWVVAGVALVAVFGAAAAYAIYHGIAGSPF